LGWLGGHTTVVIVGDGAEWIWNRATWFIRRCGILDFRHALEHAWTLARLRYGDGSAQADRWVRQIGEDLRAGKVLEVIARRKRLRPHGMGSGAVESAHKQVIHARLRQAGMRWSEAGARRLLALRLLLLSDSRALLDRLRMPSLA
jgi:hypothetical protein